MRALGAEGVVAGMARCAPGAERDQHDQRRHARAVAGGDQHPASCRRGSRKRPASTSAFRAAIRRPQESGRIAYLSGRITSPREYGRRITSDTCAHVTDVEDKIIDAARANNEPIEALTERTTRLFHDDMGALGALPPDVEPRATAHIPQMIRDDRMGCIAGGHAYAAEGHVLFAVGSWEGYGKLARRSRDEMIAGARRGWRPLSCDPGDFVLWKPSTPTSRAGTTRGDAAGPAGTIECSAMSENTTGRDLRHPLAAGSTPHLPPPRKRESPKASAAHDGRPFARCQLHNGMRDRSAARRWRSPEGNFITVARRAGPQRTGRGDPPGAARHHITATLLDWTEDRLREARYGLDRLAAPFSRESKEHIQWDKVADRLEPIVAPLADDLNSHEALRELDLRARAIKPVLTNTSTSPDELSPHNKEGPSCRRQPVDRDIAWPRSLDWFQGNIAVPR